MAEEKSNKVKLGLGEYEIEFDRASLFFFDDMAPRPFARIMIEAEQGLRISDVIRLVWVAVRREDPKITLELVTELMPPEKYGEITGIVMAAIGKFMGWGDQKTEAPLVPTQS